MAQFIGKKSFEELTQKANASDRRRMNLNIHSSYDDPCQRLIIAMEPDSYVPVHRHLDPPKDECFVILQGSIGLFIFDDEGSVVESKVLSVGGECQIADIKAGEWHTAIALEKNTVFLEFKAGPYAKIADSDFAKLTPAIVHAGAERLLESLKN